MIRHRLALLLAATLLLAGCQSEPTMPTVDHVDLKRYMGDWYVIAHIPTFIERNAYNAIERYSLNDDGSIDTVFTFREGGFDGEQKRYNPTGFVRSEDNAEWGMRFVWPIQAEFLVVWLDEDYTQTVIGRSKRDYVWIMAREPQLPEADYDRIVEFLAEQGYDVDAIRKVPHDWPEAS